MRFELVLILWVTAIVSVAALFSPDVDQSLVSNTVSLDDNYVTNSSAVSAKVEPSALVAKIEGSRPIFVRVAQESPPPVEPEPGPVEVPAPELRGIVTVSGARKAVFYDGTPEGRYVLVSVGEKIGDIAIEAIGTDQVAGREQSGEPRNFLLRANGETGRQ